MSSPWTWSEIKVKTVYVADVESIIVDAFQDVVSLYFVINGIRFGRVHCPRPRRDASAVPSQKDDIMRNIDDVAQQPRHALSKLSQLLNTQGSFRRISVAISKFPHVGRLVLAVATLHEQTQNGKDNIVRVCSRNSSFSTQLLRNYQRQCCCTHAF